MIVQRETIRNNLCESQFSEMGNWAMAIALSLPASWRYELCFRSLLRNKLRLLFPVLSYRFQIVYHELFFPHPHFTFTWHFIHLIEHLTGYNHRDFPCQNFGDLKILLASFDRVRRDSILHKLSMIKGDDIVPVNCNPSSFSNSLCDAQRI